MITRTKTEIDFLTRVDQAYRAGATQDEIAEREQCSTSALRWRVAGLGFRFERKGGLRLVDTLLGRSFSDLVERGEIVVTAADDAA